MERKKHLILFEHCVAYSFLCTIPQSKSELNILSNTRYHTVQLLPSFVYLHLFFCVKVSIENKSKEEVFMKKGTVVTGSFGESLRIFFNTGSRLTYRGFRIHGLTKASKKKVSNMFADICGRIKFFQNDKET
jgi:hypothetical protein